MRWASWIRNGKRSLERRWALYQALRKPAAHRRGVRPRLEILEDRTVPSAVTVDASQAIRTATSQVLGVNLAWWDTSLNTTQTQQMVQAAGLNFFRFPGGSSSDTWHFNVGPTYGGEGTTPSMASFIASVNGTGMVTVNYGTGSPQEGAALLAYLDGNVGDTTQIGVGLQWSSASNSWVSVNWGTAGYWAGLRASTPLAQDDGLNFLRIGRAAPFGIKYFEIGNEEYGSWETDEHATPHDPATYVAFAKQFAAFAAQIDPNISIGVDGSGTGGSYSQIPGNWTAQVLQQCAQQGFIPGFISDHNYMFDPGNENDANLLLDSATNPNATGYGGPINWAGRAQAYRSLINEYLGAAGANVQLLATEFNSVSSDPSNQTTSLVNGLWLADALGGLLETEYNGAIFWDLRNGYDTSYYNPNLYGWRTGGDYGILGSSNGSPPATGTYVPYPTYFAEQLVSQMVHTGDRVVQASSDDSTLSAYAVREQNGHLDLLVINKNPSTDLTEQINIAGFTPSGQAVVWQYGKAQDTAQSQTTDGHSSLANSTQTLAVSGSSFSYLFPQYSMTVLDLAPATYVVTSTADTNTPGTLRYGINQANTGKYSEIDFNIGTQGTSSGVQTISPATPLPALTASGVFINGYSENQWQGVTSTAPLVELNGSGAGSSSDGLLVQGSNCTVSGLVIENFSNNGIEVDGSNNTIGGTSTGARNLISGNFVGIRIDSNTSGVIVQGDYIGTDPTGTKSVANDVGIEDLGINNTIGGTTSGAGNVVSGNEADGILIHSGDQVRGNCIGTDPTGTTANPNGNNGIDVEGNYYLPSTSGGNIIGGTSAAARNIISANGNDGIYFFLGASGNLVQGNYVGLDSTGNQPLGNGGNGIFMTGDASGNVAQANTIGGTTSGALNVISANKKDGILLTSGSTGNLVEGNDIGTNYNGTSAVGNGGSGIEVADNNNTIGGAVTGEGNLISGNATDGVLVSAGTGNTIRQNSIFANSGLGIALASGANNNIVAPTISTAGMSGATLTVQGSFTAATTNVPYVLEFFANPTNDAEGKVYIGSLTVTPTGTGTPSFTYTTTTTVTGTYPLITATLTDSSGDTSPFSNGVAVASFTPYVITSTADDGSAGTLRDAINQVNAGKYNEINFNIAGTGVQTINLTSALPAITAGVFINGQSENQFQGVTSTSPLIELNGSGAGSTSDGLLLTGSNCVVSGLIIESFGKNGIEVAASNNTVGGPTTGLGNVISGNTKDGLLIDSNISGVVVQGNYIGTNVAGSAALANSVGVEVAGSNNTIGGTSSGARNVISGNSADGVLLDDGSSGNQVLGSYIGTNYGGTAAVANKIGIEGAGSSNTVGGSSAAGYRNVISGNSGDGVLLDSTGAGNVIQGNYVGTDSNDGAALGNGGSGIEIAGNNNTVGGTASLVGNILSGNSGDGLRIDSSASGTLVQGNGIGMGNVDSALGNRGNGVNIAGNSNIIGGTSAAARNTISGNTADGVLIVSGASGNLVHGNYIGTDNSGTIAVANSIGILVSSSQNTIGGSVAGAGNLISGNRGDGVQITSGVSGVLLLGNYIGTDSTGTKALANSIGVEVAGSNNSIGSSVSAAATYNVISGNTGDGVLIDSGVTGVLVQGDWIGTAFLGNAALGNKNGVEVAGSNNTVGTSYAVAPSVISGNSNDGVLLDSGSSGNQVLGSYIGTNAAGTAAVANKVGIEDAGSSNTIGGSVLGDKNVISGNSSDGVLIDSGAKNETMQGNYIGTDVGASTALANGSNGVEIKGAGNTIGGNSQANYFTRNYIGGNSKDGVLLDSGASGNQVLGNFIGIAVSGTNGVGNSTGIEIAGSSNTIGGSISGNRNVISGSGNDGVLIDGAGAHNLLQDNYVGTDYTGTSAVANSGNGIEIQGTGNTVSAGNILAGNSKDGVRIDSTASGTLVQGNYIGINILGAALANSGNGLNIAGNSNTIGGTVSAAGNIISGNTSDGVLIASGASGNQVLGNFIGTNIGGTASVANSIGVEIAGNSNTLGGSASGALNLISGNTNDGVKIDSGASSNQVLGNAIGVNVYDSGALGNSGNGIEVAGNSNTIGALWSVAPNEISGNSNDGVFLDSGSSGNQVLGNYIGANLAGTTALANKVGIEDAGSSNTIGGSVLGARNVISGNSGDGVLNDSTATGEVIESNYIGLNVDASAILANGGNGIEVQGTGSTIGGNSGTTYFVRNYIGSNSKDGVLFDSGASGNQVLGNFIGVDISGTNGVGNVANAIEIAGSSNTIGGTTQGVGNVISGSGNDGVLIDSTGAKDLLQGNYVGTDYTGTSAVANSGNGIEVQGMGNTVSAGNVISGNSKDGVLVSAGSGNTISQNSIFANAGLGISLTNGANNDIAAPSLSLATISGSTLTVTGTFTAATANVSYVLEFFANPSGDAEGKIYLFSKTVTPTITGPQTFTFSTTTSVTGANPLITATLTDNTGDTSEFSGGVTV
jgi:hypothetical protein